MSSMFFDPDDPFILALKKSVRKQIENFDIIIDPKISKEEALKRNAEIVKCDRCGVSGNRPNMMRWHFENCKTILKEYKHCGAVIPRQGIKDVLYEKKIYCNQVCYYNSKKGKPFITMTDQIKNKISQSACSRSKELSNRMKENKVWLKSNRWKK